MLEVGDERLWNRLKERDAIDSNPDASGADYVRAAELQAKVAELGGCFWRGHPFRPHILLLDEPTNHLDINTIRCPGKVLNAHSSTIVVIVHDRHFLNSIWTHRRTAIGGPLAGASAAATIT